MDSVSRWGSPFPSPLPLALLQPTLSLDRVSHLMGWIQSPWGKSQWQGAQRRERGMKEEMKDRGREEGRKEGGEEGRLLGSCRCPKRAGSGEIILNGAFYFSLLFGFGLLSGISP